MNYYFKNYVQTYKEYKKYIGSYKQYMKNQKKKKKKEHKISIHQTAAVWEMKGHKNYRKDKNNTEVKPGQLLGLLHGPPGSGKTFTIQELGEIMQWSVLLTATTHSAASELDGYTINEICKTGRNLDTYPIDTLNSQKITKIKQALKDVDLLVIDEISMLTAATLDRIDLHLRAAFDSQYVFGGKDIVLVGDFWQFDPVSEKNIKNIALYQTAVRVERGQSVYNDQYKRGAKTFMLFKLVKLTEQHRAKEKYNDWLMELRNYKKTKPIDDEWLKKLKFLKAEDMQDTEIDWVFTPTIVSGNHERRKIILHKMTLFAEKYREPILRWINHVKRGKNPNDLRYNTYGKPNFDPEELFPELVQYFVRGAECVLTDKVHGFPKGTLATCIDVAWKNPKHRHVLDKLKPGLVHRVEQPDYVIIQIKPKPKDDEDEKEPLPGPIIPVPLGRSQFEDKIETKKRRANNGGKANKAMKSFEQHPCQLTISKTYHMTQGGTLKSIILSLNSALFRCKSIKLSELRSVYVGLSRVHDFAEHRVLELSAEEKEALKQFTIDPLLRIFFQNYDPQGNWIYGGLKEDHEKDIKQAKLELGMIEFNSLVGDDCTWFADKFDLQVTKKDVPGYKKRLRKYHLEGRNLLLENNAILLKCKRDEIIEKLRKKKISKLSCTQKRWWAKRLGMTNIKRKFDKQLLPFLQNIITNTKKFINNTDNDIVEMYKNMNDLEEIDELNDDPNDEEVVEQMDEQMHINISNTNVNEQNEEDADIDMHNLNSNDNANKMIQDEDIDMKQDMNYTKNDKIDQTNVQQDTSNNGRVFYQTDYYTKSQLNNITKTGANVKMLFGDNDIDNNRNMHAKRQNSLGQAEIMKDYDQTYAFGIITTFYNSDTPNFTNFQKLMNKQFIQLRNLLLAGYDIVIPTPTKHMIGRNLKTFCRNGEQIIFHNLGTGIGKLGIEYLLYIQHKIDQLKKYTKYKKFTMIKCYSQNNITKIIDSNALNNFNFNHNVAETIADQCPCKCHEKNEMDNDIHCKRCRD